MELPIELQESCRNYASYPLNLILSDTKNYHSTLESCKTRLDENEGRLTLKNETFAHVSIRELYDGINLTNSTINIHTFDKLCEIIRVHKVIDEVQPILGPSTASKTATLKCRFIYIYGRSSRDQLRITRNMLAQIFTYHQVMPAYLDFMFIFGAQCDARDLRFSGFRKQNMLKNPLNTKKCQSSNIPELGRSGQQFQLCYNLKGVTLKTNSGEDRNSKDSEWSIRQASIHHQFDVVYGTTLWIVTKGGLDIQKRFEKLTGPDGRIDDKSFGDTYACFRSSLAAHLMFCHWSTEDWRWYIAWMEVITEKESSMALYGRLGSTLYEPAHIQELQCWKDRMNETVMILGANIQVLTSLRKFYISLKSNRDFPLDLKRACREDIDGFAADLDETIEEFKSHALRARLLVSILGDRKELILQHLQGQTAARTDQLNRNLEKEAIVMRIVTIVTLIYLPATFVSTFFSTNIIQYQNTTQESKESFSALAMNRWLEVTLPLTTITLLIAWLTYKGAETTRKTRETQISQKAAAPGIGKKRAKIWFRKFCKIWNMKKNKQPLLPVCNESKDTASSSESHAKL